MNVLSQLGTSHYQNRTVTIDVTGVCQQSVLKQGSYQVKVPYSQMAQAMRNIHRRGGQVASVQVLGNPAVPVEQAADDNDAPVEDADNGKKKSTKRKRR